MKKTYESILEQIRIIMAEEAKEASDWEKIFGYK